MNPGKTGKLLMSLGGYHYDRGLVEVPDVYFLLTNGCNELKCKHEPLGKKSKHHERPWAQNKSTKDKRKHAFASLTCLLCFIFWALILYPTSYC